MQTFDLSPLQPPAPLAAAPAIIDAVPAFDNRASRHAGRAHLLVEIGGLRIRYAYIRKNGCSAFKAAMGYHSETRIAAIRARHRAPFLMPCDASVFVWRDPVKRLVSLYRNKVLDGTNNADFIRRLLRHTGEVAPSFDRFVEFAVRGLDPHCWPQTACLQPLAYSHAIPLDHLHATMTGIVGEGAAAPFARPVNSSRDTPVEVSQKARNMIRHHYAADYRMIATVSGQPAPLP